MSEIVGSMGAQSRAPADPDLELIYRGGDKFLQRMQAMSELRDRQEAAYAKLKLGEDAQQANADAMELRDDAQKHRDLAHRAMEDATKSAAETIEAANKSAAKTRSDAQAAADDLRRIAGQVRSDADSYAVKVKAAADAVLTQAERVKRDAEAKREELVIARNNATDAEQAALDAKARWDEKHATLAANIAKLDKVLAEIHGG